MEELVLSKDYNVIKTFFGQGEYKNRKACVLVKNNEEKNEYGAKLVLGDQQVALEWYRGYSQHYAEDAAENYTLGIKKI